MPETEYIHPHMAACLMAVAHGARSVTEVMAEVNMSRGQTWTWLDRLRDAGLIIWPENTDGTMRPNFGIVVTRETP